jgi:2-iminobutanoate/2-iminopropanoate deaminase
VDSHVAFKRYGSEGGAMSEVEYVRVGNALDLEGFPISAASRVGEMIFTSGVISLDPETGTVVEGDIAVQGRQTLDNLALVLEAAGSSLQKIALVQVFLADIQNDLKTFNAVYSEYFSENHPPRYAVGAKLAWKELKVEVHAIAVA